MQSCGAGSGRILIRNYDPDPRQDPDLKKDTTYLKKLNNFVCDYIHNFQKILKSLFQFKLFSLKFCQLPVCTVPYSWYLASYMVGSGSGTTWKVGSRIRAKSFRIHCFCVRNCTSFKIVYAALYVFFYLLVVIFIHFSVVQDQSCVRIRTGNVSANPTGGYGYFTTLGKKTFFSNKKIFHFLQINCR